MQDAGLYVHIPFCEKKCRYCSFYSKEICITDETNYLNALKNHLKTFSIPENIMFSTIYFGGGTPSILSPSFYEKLLEFLYKEIPIKGFCEISLEANPEHCKLDLLKDYQSAGINRLSIGFQSNQNTILKKLGRIHSTETAQQAVLNACKVFSNISCDFMIGITEQTASSSALFNVPFLDNIQHISLYILEGEKNTSMFMEEDKSATLYEQCCSYLENNQFYQYEISNFAKVNFKSKHNMHYWTMNPYIGIGPSAHSFFNSRRSHQSPSLTDFMNGTFSKNTIQYSQDELAREALMLSLRTIKGADIKLLSRQFSYDYSHVIRKIILTFPEFLSHEENFLKMNRKGFLISNEIFEKILFD